MPTAARGWRTWVSLGFALQGLMQALVLTNLPGISERVDIGEAQISMVTLVTVLFAGGGSVLAERIAVRRGSAWALAPAFGVQAIAAVFIMLPLPFVALFPVFALFGLGIGMADAGNAMQALTVQRAYGREIISRFYAFQTVAAGTGAIVVALVNASPLPFVVGIGLGAATLGALAAPMRARLAPDPEPRDTEHTHRHPRLPWRGLTVIGIVVGIAFVADSVVGSWSSIFLDEVLAAPPLAIPLGYAAYQVLTLVSRLVGDRLVERAGRARVLIGAVVVASTGMAIAGLAPAVWVAIAGFGLAGLGIGLMAPLSFAAAGDMAPAYTDEIAARLNLFNYAGVVVGSGATGFIAEALTLRVAVVIPAVVLLAALFAAGAYRAPRPARVAA